MGSVGPLISRDCSSLQSSYSKRRIVSSLPTRDIRKKKNLSFGVRSLGRQNIKQKILDGLRVFLEKIVLDCPLNQWFQNLNQNHLDNLSKHRCLSLTPRVSDSVGLGSDQRICISNKFPGDTDAAIWGPQP